MKNKKNKFSTKEIKNISNSKDKIHINQTSNHPKSKSIITNFYTHSNKKQKRYGKTCIHFNLNKLTCNLSHSFCKDADNCKDYVTNLKVLNSKNDNVKDNNSIVGVTIIVLSDNRKCTNKNHKIIDLNAVIRIVKIDGKLTTYNIPAAYCKICDTYFVLRKDYKIAKEYGKILCPIIDLTIKGRAKNKNKNLSLSESRIHQLGYNVQRGSNFSKEQRQVILANIIENTNISKYEIESCIIRPMSQHKGQSNYADAVSAWEQDLEFVRNYNLGDIPEVSIDKVIIGRRK